MTDKKERVIWHQSGVNPKGEPFVQLFVDDKIAGQFTPEEARAHAHAMMEAAEAAEQDAFMFHFHTQRIGAEPEHAMMVIVEFRKFREERGKKGPASDRREFVDPNQSEKF
jgi:hypothetical protein